MSLDMINEGLPINKKWKPKLVLILFLLVLFNHNLPVISETLDYQYRNYATLAFIAGMLIASIGSIFAELLVVAIALLAIISNSWDFVVMDISELRRQIYVGSIVFLGLALLIGKVSFSNLIDILINTLGVRRK